MYAGFWKRFAAFIIDSIIVYLLAFATVSVAGLMPASNQPDFGKLFIVFFVYIAFYVLYWAIFECSPMQATPGKMTLGIKVVDMSGQRVSFATSLWRNIGKIVSNLTLNIGYVMAGFTVRKQALHDKMAGCLVVDKNADAANLQPLPKAGAGIITLAVLGALSPYIIWTIFMVMMASFIYSYVKTNSNMPNRPGSAMQNENVMQAQIAGFMLDNIVLTQKMYAQQNDGEYLTSLQAMKNYIPALNFSDDDEYKLLFMPDSIAVVVDGEDDMPDYIISKCYGVERTCIDTPDAAFARQLGWVQSPVDICCL